MKWIYYFFLCLLFCFSQNQLLGQILQGQVIDDRNGASLVGATVQWISSGKGTSTNTDGFFAIKERQDSLEVRYLGYESARIFVENTDWLDIRLQPDTMTITTPVVSDRRILFNTPHPFVTLPREVLWQDNGTSIAPALNQVPGVFMHSGSLNTNRITVRGIGSRNAFGTAKIRAFIDGIPLTNGTGETNLEDIDLSLLEQVTVWKGPSASHLGASLGGVIELETKATQTANGSNFNNVFTIGSFGLLRNVAQTRISSENNRSVVLLNHNLTHSDGYRDNNEYDRQSFNLLSRVDLEKGNQLTFFANYTDLLAFIPSSLSEADFAEDSRQAAFTWQQVRGFEDVEKALFGVSHRYLKGRWQIHSNVYTSWQENYELRPFGILNEASRAVGLRTKGTYYHDDWAQVSLGGEYYRERYNGETFAQIDRQLGAPESDQEQVREYVNLFAEVKGQLGKWRWEAGLNVNETNYTLQDLFVADSIDQSGAYTFDLIASPRIGLSYDFVEQITAYALLSHGFSAPTIAETLTPEGLVNTEIQPERGWNMEVGSRGRLLQDRLQYDLAVFRMSVTDLLVARRVGQDQFVGVNAGKTIHRGIEAYLSYQLPAGIRLQASYTFADYEFEEFMDLEEDYSGNPLTGVAPHVFYGTGTWETPFGYYLQMRFQYVDEMPLRDDASIYTDPYALVHLQTGLRKDLGQFLSIDIEFGLNNVLDKQYASMVLINAASFGGRAPRYYYPGEARNWYVRLGLNVSWGD